MWLARNDFRFCSLQPSTIPVIEGVKARVKFHSTVFFKHQRTAHGSRFFTHRWGGNGVIASFAGGNLTLFCNFYFICLPTSPCFAYLCTTYVIVFMLVGWGSIPWRVWRAGAPPFKAFCRHVWWPLHLPHQGPGHSP